MNNRAFIVACFGYREEQIQRLLNNIRSYVDYPIYIITTKDSEIGLIRQFDNVYVEYVSRIWQKETSRADIRNSNYYKVSRALKLPYISFCLLDDDMFIMDKNFVDGFEIAERFGVALPLNPRVYIKYNAMGADVQQKDLDEIKDWSQYAPACNFSPFFVSPQHQTANVFLKQLKDELRFNTCRGTLAVWKASWKTGFTPIYLPEQWCVCVSNADYIKNYIELLQGQRMQIPVMCLHLGHEEVRKVFGID